MSDPKAMPAAVAAAFETYPPAARRRLLTVRKMVFAAAAANDRVGAINETLKWGEPAYLTTASKSGSTIRLAWKSATPDRYALYFNCKTDLVDTFRTLYPEELSFEGNRAITLPCGQPLPKQALSRCIEAALTYHLTKRKQRQNA
jgi:hypothetical protein